MLLCITPNPAIDRTLTVPNLQLDGVNRASECRVAAGGKGVNVARAARTLGSPVCCAGFAGGGHGALLAALLEGEALPGAWTAIAGETRTCTILIDPEHGHNTVVNEPGPAVTGNEWDELLHECRQLGANAGAVCVSGSLPPGSPLTRYHDLLELLHPADRPVWVDIAGAPLGVAARMPGLRLKVNGDEAAVLAGQPLPTMDAIAGFARAQVERGAAVCVITLGGDGALLAAPTGVWLARPPAIRRTNAVASGDSFLAGLMAAQLRGLALPEALAWATAAGAANAAFGGGAAFSRSQFESLLPGLSVERFWLP